MTHERLNRYYKYLDNCRFSVLVKVFSKILILAKHHSSLILVVVFRTVTLTKVSEHAEQIILYVTEIGILQQNLVIIQRRNANLLKTIFKQIYYRIQ